MYYFKAMFTINKQSCSHNASHGYTISIAAGSDNGDQRQNL